MIEKILRGIINIIRIGIIRIRCGNTVTIPWIQPMRVKTQLLIQKNTHTAIGHNFKLETDSKIRVIQGGSLTIGNNCFINCGSYITALGKTIIGNNCMFGPNVMIFDHDHDYKSEGGISDGKVTVGEIIIGDNVWIGANCVILRDTYINDNAVIAAGSVVKGNVPSGCLFVQKRSTEIMPVKR